MDKTSADADDEAAQTGVIAFLSDPRTHGGAAVDRVDTPISRVFLAGERAYKMRRAIATNFLDFSSPALRRDACRRELAVNRCAGDLYLGVVAVTRDADGLRLGGAGAPLEWLTVMRRFDRSAELDRLADAGALSVPMIDALGDAVAAMHAQAPVATAAEADAPAARIDQIAGALATAGGDAHAEDVARWRAAAHARFAPLAALYARRIARGRVRRCHGDLHLGNVVALDGAPTPFDAIEFNERLATIDGLYDLAMTCGDLMARGERVLGGALLARYLSRTGDYAGLPLFPLWLSMRDAVRAMVAFGDGRAPDGVARLAAARAALAPLGRPRLICVGGVSGTGKTSVARRLAPTVSPPVGAVVIRSDVIRKRLFGVAPETPLPDGAYDEAIARRVRRRMALQTRRVLRAGLTAILDATFLDPPAVAQAQEIARAEGADFVGLWLTASETLAAGRVASRRGDASDATAAVVRRQLAHASPPAGWSVIDAAQPLERVAADAASALESDGP